MDYTRNPFFASPYLEQTGNNLIKAFNDDGHGEENRARTNLIKAQTADTTGKTAGREAAASAIQGQDFSSPTIANQFWSALAANGIRSGSDPAQVAHAVQFLRANSHASDSDIAASVVGNKGGLGVNEGVSLGDRNAISQKSEDAAMGRTKYSADSSAGAHLAGIRISNQFQEDHPTADRVKGIYLQQHPDQQAASIFPPHNIAAGGSVITTPGDPRATGPVVEGPPTERYVKAFDDQSPTGSSYQKPAAGLPAPAAVEKPLTLTPQAAADMKFNVFQSIPGAMAADGKSIDPAFQQQFGEKIQAAEIAAADIYKKTRDASAAEKMFKDTLGIKPNQSFSAPASILPSIFGRGGLSPKDPAVPLAGTAQAAPSIIAPQFSQQGAPAIAPLPTDKSQLKADTVYQTARGPAKWNGKNFDPINAPQNANDGAR